MFEAPSHWRFSAISGERSHAVTRLHISGERGRAWSPHGRNPSSRAPCKLRYKTRVAFHSLARPPIGAVGLRRKRVYPVFGKRITLARLDARHAD